MPSWDERLSARARQVRIVLRGVRAFGSAHAFLRWLHTPCGELDNRMPLSLLTSEEGIPKLEAIIGQQGLKSPAFEDGSQASHKKEGESMIQ